MDFVCNCVSVSYTHLDVYKRQVLDEATHHPRLCPVLLDILGQ